MREIARKLAAHVRAEGMPPKGTTLYELMDLAGVVADGETAEAFAIDLQEVAQDCLDMLVTGNGRLDHLTGDLFLELMRAMAGDEPAVSDSAEAMRTKIVEEIVEGSLGMDPHDLVTKITDGMSIADLSRIAGAIAADRDRGPHKPLDEPITITGFATRGTPALNERALFGGRCGDMVSIRPVGDEYGGRTYLGVFIGEIARGVSLGRRKSDDVLVYDMGWHNPAIFVPDLNKVIFGSASWWGLIESEEQLRQITDADIDGVWYVRALKALTERNAESGDQ